ILHFHWFTSFHCRETPVSIQRSFGPKHKPLSCPLQASIRFLKHPLPSTPFVGLATFIPLKECIRVTNFRFLVFFFFFFVFGAVGAICRPGTVCPFAILCKNQDSRVPY